MKLGGEKIKFQNLFKVGRIGALELKNRIVMPGMASHNCGEWGEVNDKVIDWYARRAKGGAGLIIVEATMVATAIDPFRLVSRTLRADDDCYVPGLTSLAEMVHDNGAKIGIQLTPGTGALASDGLWVDKPQNMKPVSPSGVSAPGSSRLPRSLTIEEIDKIIDLCGDSARRVKQAGFDLIEIHAHWSYLIAQFLSPYYNKRTDKYGGSLDGRCRFLLEIVRAIKKAVGPNFALTVKYSVDEFVPTGRDVKESQIIAKKLEQAGVDGIVSSGGAYGAKIPALPPYFFPKGIWLPLAKNVKEVVNIPVIATGRLDDPQLAEQVLRDGKADFIAIGRGLIADPDWPRKVASGRIEEIRPCLACNECLKSLNKPATVRCSVNAVAGRESEYGLLNPAEVKKRVLVVGGGPAGMEAARVAALRGHKVILCERRQRLGGLMLLGSVLNKEIMAFVKWMSAQIKSLPIEVRLQTEVTPSLINEIKPDVVILATGGTFITPKVPGINRDNVFNGQDFLNFIYGIPLNKGMFLRLLSPLAKYFITTSIMRRLLRLNFPIKKNGAIIGGQFPGCSLALALAKNGKEVTIIEESERIGADVDGTVMASLQCEIENGNVRTFTSMKVAEITDEGVILIDRNGNKVLHKADTVLVALELAPSDSDLADKLKGEVREVYTIGDAKSFGRIIEATSQGYITAYNL